MRPGSFSLLVAGGAAAILPPALIHFVSPHQVQLSSETHSGFVVEMNGVVSLTGAATLPVGGVILSLSAFPGARGPHAVRLLRSSRAR